MAETALRNTFRDKLAAHYGRRAKYQRIEAPSSGGGIPDAIFAIQDDDGSYLNGVIEFKEVDELPKKDDTPVKVKFKPGQTTWLTEWARVGGTSILCVKLKSEGVWLMFDAHFKEIEAGLKLEDLLKLCYWRSGVLTFPNCWPKF